MNFDIQYIIMNNIAGKTLLNTVFIRLEQVVHFWLCTTITRCPLKQKQQGKRPVSKYVFYGHGL